MFLQPKENTVLEIPCFNNSYYPGHCEHSTNDICQISVMHMSVSNTCQTRYLSPSTNVCATWTYVGYVTPSNIDMTSARIYHLFRCGITDEMAGLKCVCVPVEAFCHQDSWYKCHTKISHFLRQGSMYCNCMTETMR